MKRLLAAAGIAIALAGLLGTANPAAADGPPPNDTEDVACLSVTAGMGDHCLAVSAKGYVTGTTLQTRATIRPYYVDRAVVRTQIDRVVVGAVNQTIVSTGPVAGDRTKAAAKDVTVTIAHPSYCQRFHTLIYISARMSNGSVYRTSYVGAWYDSAFPECASAKVLDQRAVTHCFQHYPDGASGACYPQVVQLVASNDGKRVLARGWLALSGDMGLAGVTISSVALAQDIRTLDRTYPTGSGPLRAFGQPRTEAQTQSARIVCGARYWVTMLYSVRYTDGRLYIGSWVSKPYLVC